MPTIFCQCKSTDLQHLQSTRRLGKLPKTDFGFLKKYRLLTVGDIFCVTEELEGKVKSRANYERLQELQSSLVWPSITELDPKTYVPEVSNVSIAAIALSS